MELYYCPPLRMITLVLTVPGIFARPSSQRKRNMRVTLIHNSRAGDDKSPSVDDLAEMIRAAGYDVTRQSSKGDHVTSFVRGDRERPEVDRAVEAARGEGPAAARRPAIEPLRASTVSSGVGASPSPKR